MTSLIPNSNKANTFLNLPKEVFASIFKELARSYDPNGIHGVAEVTKDLVAVSHTCRTLFTGIKSEGLKDFADHLDIPSISVIKGLDDPEALFDSPPSLPRDTLQIVCKYLNVPTGGSREGSLS